MITEINKSKTLTSHISSECKHNLTEQNVIQINSAIMINANVSVRNVMHVKKIMFGILLHVVAKTENLKIFSKYNGEYLR